MYWQNTGCPLDSHDVSCDAKVPVLILSGYDIKLPPPSFCASVRIQIQVHRLDLTKPWVSPVHSISHASSHLHISPDSASAQV